MSFEKQTFKFPDPEAKDGEKAEEFVVEIEADEDDKTEKLKVEVVDDTPEKDRNKKPSAPPDEVTDEELENYSDKVRKRIQHFSKGYHDQRRAAEQAAREKAELESFANRLLEENRTLKGTVNKNQEVLLEEAKKQTERELAAAKVQFKQAYDAGQGDALVEAQEALTNAKLRAERVNNIKIPPLQEHENPVQTKQSAPVVDSKAADWQKSNEWFGQDDEMTSFALGLHQKLVKQGVDPKSDDYYEKINSRMREVFPDQFDEGSESEDTKPRRKANVVAPATRSTAPKKIVLSRTQVQLAKKLGVPLEEYAKQVAIEMRKRNG